MQAASLGMAVVEKGAALAPPADDGVAAFAALGPPPLDDPNTALRWIRQVQLVAVNLALSAPMTDALRERLKFAKDLCATVGMTHSRAAMEHEIKALRDLLGHIRTPGGAVKLERMENIQKPSTARGMRRNKPRPVPPADDTPPAPRWIPGEVPPSDDNEPHDKE